MKCVSFTAHQTPQSYRNDLDKVDNDLPASVGTPELESELNQLQALLGSLTLTYKAKKNAMENSTDPSNAGQKH